MKKIIKRISWSIHRWRIRLLFEKWFVFYLRKGLKPSRARGYAESAVLCLAPSFIHYEDYLDFVMQEFCGLPPSREKLDGDKRIEPQEGSVTAKGITL